jgi:hypothetical protein
MLMAEVPPARKNPAADPDGWSWDVGGVTTVYAWCPLPCGRGSVVEVGDRTLAELRSRLVCRHCGRKGGATLERDMIAYYKTALGRPGGRR